MNPVAFDYLDLDNATKIVENFENPTIERKEKIQAIIDSLRTNPAESERIGLNLEDVAKIVDSFENPTIEEEDLFRPGDFTPREPCDRPRHLQQDMRVRKVSVSRRLFKTACWV